MRKTITLDNGNEVTLFFRHFGKRYALADVTLRRNGVTLGRLVRDEHGNLVSPGWSKWFNSREEEDTAAAYYAAKYPDLADRERGALFEEGFTRERYDFESIIERGLEFAAAIDQGDKMLFLAIDTEGNIIGDGENTMDAVVEAEHHGWRGWFSPHRADEQTLRLVPAHKVRARVKS